MVTNIDIRAQCNPGMNMLRPPISHTPLQWITPSPDPTDRHVWSHRAWTFWAEEIVFTCDGREHGGGGSEYVGKVGPVTLVRARVRSRGYVLSDICPVLAVHQ